MRSEEAPGQEKFLPATGLWTLDTGHWTLDTGHGTDWRTPVLVNFIDCPGTIRGVGVRRNTAVNNEVNTEMGDDILSGAGHEVSQAA